MNLPLFQAMPETDCRLQENRIDLWCFSLANLPKKAKSLLNAEEATRANRFYFPRHKRRFTIARAMLRTILADYLEKDPKQLSFLYNEYGKPYLKDESQIEFSLSHSGDLGIVAVGQKYPLGVDIEYFSKRPYEGIGEQLFSKDELAELTQQPASLKALTFFKIWSKKEAFIKAIGMGLAYPTKEFTVQAYPLENELIEDKLYNSYWSMLAFMPELACSAALCCSPSIEIFRQRKLNPVDFI